MGTLRTLVVLTKVANGSVVNNRQMCRASKVGRAHFELERLGSGPSDRTTRAPDEDGNRQLFNVWEAGLARVSVLEERRGICYRNASNGARKTEYIA